MSSREPDVGPDPDAAEVVVRCRGLTRHYQRGSETVRALDGVDLEVGRGRLVALVGPSGSGKSTLMNLLGCLDRPTAGEVWLAGERVDGLSDAARVQVRRSRVGFVFQSFYLLPELTALENVALPLLFGRRRGRRARAAELLGRLGLGERLGHLPSELSGGEMQRVAVARALANDPALILADEPTGKLDTNNRAALMAVLRELVEAGVTILVATHDLELAELADEVVRLEDGRRQEPELPARI